MSETAYRVRIVVDPDFGGRLTRLPVGEPVWIVQSEANTPVAQFQWAERPGVSHLNGVTTFTPFTSGDREQVLLGILDTVDLHHGQYSADPPYSEVEVYGARLTDAVEHAFRGLGFTEFGATSDGFVAARPPAS
jgi:hypothetical protein